MQVLVFLPKVSLPLFVFEKLRNGLHEKMAVFFFAFLPPAVFAEESLPGWLVERIEHKQGIQQFRVNIRRALEKCPDWFFAEAMDLTYATYYVLQREAGIQDPIAAITDTNKAIEYMVSIYFRNANIFNKFCLGDFIVVYEAVCNAQPKMCLDYKNQYSMLMRKAWAERRAKEKSAKAPVAPSGKSQKEPAAKVSPQMDEGELLKRIQKMRSASGDLLSFHHPSDVFSPSVANFAIRPADEVE